MIEHHISFPKNNADVFALAGTSVYECITRAGLRIKNPCAGQGTCGKCRIRILSGEAAPSDKCRNIFSEKELSEGWRLACRTHVTGDLSIEVPDESVPEEGIIIVTSDDTSSAYEINPLIKKKFLNLANPTLEEPVADLENLMRAISHARFDLNHLRQLPDFMRKNNFTGTAVYSEKNLIALEDGNTENANFAVAVDIGTTTVVAALLDMNTGKQLGCQGLLNPQVKFGDDVLSRICAQSQSEKNLKTLQKEIVAALNKLIGELCGAFKVSSTNIYAVSIAGNTVMENLFLGIPVKALGEIPFIPPFSKSLRFIASELGLMVNPGAEVFIFPVIGGFVGGDIVSGLVASRLNERINPTVFVDVGTNGEIVLLYGGKLYAASAAAGPAFEGARIEAGMRAAAGAIEKVIIKDGEVLINVIRNVEPKGICGSALIDASAEMLRCGLIDETGRIVSPDECPAGTSDSLKKRLVASKDGNTHDFLLTPLESRKKIFLRQKDIRELQLASGAIRAAINILLKNAGLRESEIDSVLVAGGFGYFIRRVHAKRIGLIPNLPDAKIRFIGNSSLEGAKAVLYSRERLRYAENIAAQVKYVEVSLDPEFQTEFANAMMFPSQDQF
ncbi:MAG: ASKHA domain-containing protein [Victivallales bacterium]